MFGRFVNDEWHDYYFSHPELMPHDAMARHLFLSEEAKLFDGHQPDRFDGMTEQEAAMVQLVMDFGMRQSYGFSYFDNQRQRMSAFMINGLAGGNDISHIPDHLGDRLRIAVQFFLEGLRLREMASDDLVGALSPRELDCLHWAAVGMTTKEIADRLDISDHTVNEYIASAMRKLGAATRTQAVLRAIALELITP